jgi:hypothetical protein
MLENDASAIAEIAVAVKINESYVGRVLRLTPLAPDLVEAILAGRQPAEMTLATLMRPAAGALGNAETGTFALGLIAPLAWARRVAP